MHLQKKFFPRFHVPQPPRVVEACGTEEMPARVETHPCKAPRVPVKSLDALAAFAVPHLRCSEYTMATMGEQTGGEG